MGAQIEKCRPDNHHYFVAEVMILADSGKVLVVGLCTACGEPLLHEHAVSAGPITPVSLTQTKKE